MLNGKFFVGLPVRMMDHSQGPNRQQTNFYWPDESKMEAAVDTRTKLRNKSRFDRSPERNTENGVTTNDLHKRELTSKIELNDNLPTQKHNEVANQTIAKPSNLRRRDTFSSKIQFYDYENEPQPPMQRNNKNSNIEKNSKNNSKTSDKRISFTENKLREGSPKIEGISKNNEISAKSSTSIIKPPVKNLSKSKSMTDISRQNGVKVIENNMKNISISRPSYEEHIEPEEYVVPPRRLIRISRPVPPPRRSRPVTEYYDDIDDDYNYAPRRTLGPSKVVNNRRTYRNHCIEPEDFEESRVPTRNNHERMQTSRQHYSHRVVERRQNNIEPHYEDDYGYHYESRRTETPKQTFRRDSNLSYANQNGFDETSSINTQNMHEFSPPPAVDRNIDEGQKPNNLNRVKRSNTITPSTTSRTISRAHRHLVSNVAFWSDAEDNNSTNNPKTIRNSAVMRVSVGLPDT